MLDLSFEGNKILTQPNDVCIQKLQSIYYRDVRASRKCPSA